MDYTPQLNAVGKVTPDSARRLLVAALNQAADDFSELGSFEHDEAVRLDVALLRTMADNVTGWTHTTRLREFLQAGSTTETHAAYMADCDAIAAEAGEPA